MAELCDKCIETLFRGLQENPKTFDVLGELAEEDLSLAELMKRTKLSISIVGKPSTSCLVPR